MFRRREILKLGATAATAVTAIRSPAVAQAPPGPLAALSEGQTFSFSALQDAARALAKRPFQALSPALPDAFASLPYDAYVGIRAKRENYVWSDENRGFLLEPLHRGFVFAAPVTLNIVEDGLIRRLGYNASRFEFGKVAAPPNLPDLGFSGFRVHVAADAGFEEIAIFQGASFFRCKARGQTFGVMARALAIRTADARGEEFPFFRAFWIERPLPGTGVIVINALADSESAVAAFRFTMRPGDATLMDTEATVCARAPIDHLGLAPMQSTFLFSDADREGVDDYRPNVHDSGGLQVLNGAGEWLWRPLSNPESLQVAGFLDKDPKGFGLVQRNRDAAGYYDEDQRFELRPSLWIEPIGEWGAGSVQLVEIPTETEVNNNIVTYWRPQGPLAAGAELSLAYRQFWCWTLPDRPRLATVATTRSGKGPGQRARRFMVEFAGDAIGVLPDGNAARVVLSATPGAVAGVRATFLRDRKTMRVRFDFDPGGDTLSEMRLVLTQESKPISETWLYRWTQ